MQSLRSIIISTHAGVCARWKEKFCFSIAPLTANIAVTVLPVAYLSILNSFRTPSFPRFNPYNVPEGFKRLSLIDPTTLGWKVGRSVCGAYLALGQRAENTRKTLNAGFSVNECSMLEPVDFSSFCCVEFFL